MHLKAPHNARTAALAASRKPLRKHSFFPADPGVWTCIECMLTTYQDPYARKKILRCPGQLSQFRRLVAEASQVRPCHRLHLCFIDGMLEKPMLFCSRCFTYSSGNRRLLVVGCGGLTAKARQSEKAIKLHKHPKNGRPLIRIQPLRVGQGYLARRLLCSKSCSCSSG